MLPAKTKGGKSASEPGEACPRILVGLKPWWEPSLIAREVGNYPF